MRPREEVLGSRIPRGATQNSKSPHRGGLDVETTRSRGGDVLSAHPWAHRIAAEGNRGGGTEAGYPPVEIERSPRSRLIAGCAKIRIAARPWLRRRRNRNGDPEDRAVPNRYLVPEGTNKKVASLDPMKDKAPGENSESCWCNIT